MKKQIVTSSACLALTGLAAALTLLAAAGAAVAAVPQLVCRPADALIAVGETAQLSIAIDEPLALRTVEVWIRHDPAVALGVSGRPGLLFRTSGAYVFSGYDQIAPGVWHGYAVVMGSTVWVTGPGELYEWTFRGVAPGVTAVAADSLRLFDPEANLIAGSSLLPATVRVWDPTLAGVPEAGACELAVFPNPFNPRARLRFSLPAAGPVRIEVLDIRGRRLRLLLQGVSGAGPGEVPWDGTDDEGRAVAGGVYLFRLSGPGGAAAVSRGVLLR